MKKVALVVLNYNGEKVIESLLQSIKNQTYNKYDLIILDNASGDRSIQKIQKFNPNIPIIRFKKNIGFARAFNFAANNFEYDFLLFLNNDLVLHNECVENLITNVNQHEDALILNSKAMYMTAKNIINASGGKLTYIGGSYLVNHKKKNIKEEKKAIGTAYGASMLVNRKIFLKLEGFDPDFFMYHEEADLCWRSWLFNYPIIYCPSSIVYHYEKLNWSKNPVVFNEFHKTKNRYISILKNCQFPYIMIFLFISIIYDINFLLIKLNLNYINGFLKAYRYLFKNIGYIILKRKKIQDYSINSFKTLRRWGIFSSFSELFERFKMIN